MTITSAVTGDGSITVNRLGSSGYTQILSSTANTFTGTLTVNALFNPGSATTIKWGAGTLIIGSNNSGLTGAHFVQEGTLRLANNGATGTTAGGIVVSNGAALELSNSVAIGAEALTISGNSISNGGALRNVASNTSSYAGAITIGTGGARINSDSGGSLTLSGGVATSPHNHVTFGGAGNTTVSTAAISGAGGAIKDGAGTLTLSTTNTYTGETKVNAGTFAVAGAGSTNNTSGITIASKASFKYNSSTTLSVGIINNGGTISGTGNIAVNLGLNSTSDIVSPGNSPGIQPSAVSQTWSSFTYEWETNNFTGTTAGTDFDQIAITGDLNLTGAAPGSYILDLIPLTAGNLADDVPNFSEINRSWNILTTTGSITGFDASYSTIDGITGPNVITTSPARGGS